MANTKSAKRMTRKIARRTEVNKTARSRLRTYVRKVEEAIASGDRTQALAAMQEAEPVIMRAAQKGIVHRNAASRKVSRLVHGVRMRPMKYSPGTSGWTTLRYRSTWFPSALMTEVSRKGNEMS